MKLRNRIIFLTSILCIAIGATFTLTGCVKKPANEEKTEEKKTDKKKKDKKEKEEKTSKKEDEKKEDTSSNNNSSSNQEIIAYADDTIPATSSPVITYNNNVPQFTQAELDEAQTSYTYFSNQDALGRPTLGMASISTDTIQVGDSGWINDIIPVGWINKPYGCIDGGHLYLRSSLIGFELTGQQPDSRNLFTCTKYTHDNGILPYQTEIFQFVQNSNYHVLYRSTPIYDGNNLVPSGIHLEAQSVEDGGQGLSFNVYCYNLQPGVTIDYATGDNYDSGTCPALDE